MKNTAIVDKKKYNLIAGVILAIIVTVVILAIVFGDTSRLGAY